MKEFVLNKFVEKLFHINAGLLLLVSLLAYWTPNGMLIAVILFLFAIGTEIAYIMFKQESDELWGTYLGSVRRKVKKLNKKKQEFICTKCRASLPVMK